MSNIDNDPYSNNKASAEFTAMFADAYSGDEAAIIACTEAFYTSGIDYSMEVERLMENAWLPHRQVDELMMMRIDAASSKLSQLVRIILAHRMPEIGVRDIANIIAFDQKARIDYFVGISTVLFEESSTEDELILLFQNLVNTASDTAHSIKQISIVYRTLLTEQGRALRLATLKA
jgi:hypothetical protein